MSTKNIAEFKLDFNKNPELLQKLKGIKSLGEFAAVTKEEGIALQTEENMNCERVSLQGDILNDDELDKVVGGRLEWGIKDYFLDISSAVLNSSNFFEQDLEGVSQATIGLYGNAEDGYQFTVEG
jgi:hypothetical protein